MEYAIYLTPRSCHVSYLPLKTFKENFQSNLIGLPNCEFAPRRKFASFTISFWMVSCSFASVWYSNTSSVLSVSDSMLSCLQPIAPLHPLVAVSQCTNSCYRCFLSNPSLPYLSTIYWYPFMNHRHHRASSSSFLIGAGVTVFAFSDFYPFHDGGRYHIGASPLICSANQWTFFYMISASVMKGLKGK